MDVTTPSPTEESDSMNHAPQQTHQHPKKKPPPPKPKDKPPVATKPQLRTGAPVKRDADQMLLATVGHAGGTASVTQTSSMEVSIQPHRSPPPPTTRMSPPAPPRQNKSDNSLFNQANQPPVISRSQAVVSQMPVLPARTRAAPHPTHAISMDNLSSHRALPVPPDSAGQVRTSPHSTPTTPTTARAAPPPLPPQRTTPQQIRASGPGVF